jgi:hypothetical protein
MGCTQGIFLDMFNITADEIFDLVALGTNDVVMIVFGIRQLISRKLSLKIDLANDTRANERLDGAVYRDLIDVITSQLRDDIMN